MKLGLGLLQDEFELSGEYQTFMGWMDRCLLAGIEIQLFSPKGLFLRAHGYIQHKYGEYVWTKWLEQKAFIGQAVSLASEVDLLHLFLPTPGFLWIGDQIKKKSKRPIYVTCLGEEANIDWRYAGLLVRESFRFHVMRYVAAQCLPKSQFLCDRYIVGNAFLARQLIQLGCPVEKIAIVAPLLPKETAPDAFSLQVAREMESQPTFVYMGHFLPNKGVDMIVRAFSQVPHLNARLHLIWSGLGNDRRVEQWCDKWEKLDRIRIFRQPMHRGTILSKARAVIAPFKVSYGQVSPPIILLEAMRAGSPIILSDTASMRAFFCDASSEPIFINPFVWQSLRDKMLFLLSQSQMVQEISGNLKKWIYTRWDALDPNVFYADR